MYIPFDCTVSKLTPLPATVFNLPIALVTVVDIDRIWFKSSHGLESVEHISRDPGLCASAILSDEIYIVEDAKNDPRCLLNPLVRGEFGLQFYAGAPLHTSDGYNLGTFCIIDKKQRYFTKEQISILGTLSEVVMDEIELRLAARELSKEIEQKIADLEKRIRLLTTN